MSLLLPRTTRIIQPIESPLTGDYPISLATWLKQNRQGSDQVVFGVRNAAATHRIEITVANNNTALAQAAGTGGGNAAVSSALIKNGWHHLTAVFDSDTSRTIMVDGGYLSGSVATATVSVGVIFSNLSRISFGSSTSVATSLNWGAISHTAIWNVSLTKQDAERLWGGATPDHVRPDGLIAYWPLTKDGRDITGRNPMRIDGAAIIDDPPRVRGRLSNVYVIPTNIKSINGLLKSAIASRNGLAMSSIKSINGLS